MKLSKTEIHNIIANLGVSVGIAGQPNPTLSGVPTAQAELIARFLLDGHQYLADAERIQAYFGTPSAHADTFQGDIVILQGDGRGPVTIFDTDHLSDDVNISLDREELADILSAWVSLIRIFPTPYGLGSPK
jgi:hypothetical protein